MCCIDCSYESLGVLIITNKIMYTIIYNEGLGFTEYKKVYSSLNSALRGEGFNKMLTAHIYKNNQRIQ